MGRDRRGSAHEKGVVTDSRFGPSAVLTPANLVTIGRLLVTPLLIVMIAVWGSAGRRLSWLSVSVPLTASTVTSQEGKGRRRSGAFLDPLADKAIVVPAPTRCSPRGKRYHLVAGGADCRTPSCSMSVSPGVHEPA